MIKARLEGWLHIHKMLPDNQFQYREGVGTTLVIHVMQQFSKNNYIPALFLDEKAAYDTVDILQLNEKIINILFSVLLLFKMYTSDLQHYIPIHKLLLFICREKIS